MARAPKIEKTKTSESAEALESTGIAKAKEASKKSTDKSASESVVKASATKNKTKNKVEVIDKFEELENKSKINLENKLDNKLDNGLEHDFKDKIAKENVVGKENVEEEIIKEKIVEKYNFEEETKQEEIKNELKKEVQNKNQNEVKKIFTPRFGVDADACIDINEGMPMKAMPTKCLPELIGASIVAPEQNTKDSKDAKHKVSKKDGMQQALDILDDYYKDTSPRDPRFQQHEE